MTVTDLDPYVQLLRDSNAILAAGNDPPEVVLEPLRDFLKRPLPKSESLVGVTRNGTNLLPRYGWVMPWGKEGSSKTSVIVDLLFHAACGTHWLHYPIARPLRIVAIINEGVPGGLQDKLAQKTEVWEGDTELVLDNLAIYASPWGEFTFKNTAIADHARAYALDFQADYLALDPLHTLGTTGAGTPEQTETFKHTLREYGLWQDLGFITAHHSNKSGMVSGDWGRHVDTLIHIEKDGKRPATKFTLEKARPADPDELHVPQLLEWETATIGYRRVALEPERVSDDDLLQRIHSALRDAETPLRMSWLQDAVKGETKRVAALVRAEIQVGRIVNQSTHKGRYELIPTLLGFHNETEHADKAMNTQQTRMDTNEPLGYTEKPSSPGNDDPPEGGLLLGYPLSPFRGEEYTAYKTTGHDSSPIPDADLEQIIHTAQALEADEPTTTDLAGADA